MKLTIELPFCDSYRLFMVAGRKTQMLLPGWQKMTLAIR